MFTKHPLPDKFQVKEVIMIYVFLKTITLTYLLAACGGGSSSGDTAPDPSTVADAITSAEDVVPTSRIEVPTTPSQPSEEQSEVVEEEEEEPALQDMLNLTVRKSIDFSTSGQVISVPHNAAYDAWSNDKAFTWSFVLVKDASAGTEALPIVSRGQSSYSVRVDFTNERLFIEGADPKGSHYFSRTFSELNLSRASDGSLNLPITITRSAIGVETWYVSTSRMKVFHNLDTDDSAETEAIRFGSISGGSAEFQGQLDMVSFWDKELSIDEVIELVTEYDPRNHSAFDTDAVSVWPMGEDLEVEGNENGAAVYDIRSAFHASTSNMDSSNFVEVDLTTLNSLVLDNYAAVTSSVVNASDGAPLEGATVTLIGLDSNHVATADASGVFNFTEIPIKPYALRVEAAGYTSYSTSFDSASSNYIALSKEITDSGDDDFRIIATWDADPVNIDFFLTLYNGYGALIGMASSAGSYVYGDFTASVENDTTDSYGPETLVINNLPSGYLFKVLLANYSSGVTVDTDAAVQIYKGNSLLAEYKIAEVTNPDSSSKIFFEVGVYNDSFFYSELSYVLTP